MRAFVAVELPPAARAALAELQRDLANARADVTWVEEANLHVTMRFLGEITQEQRQAIERLLRDLAGRTKAMTLSLSSLGAFPSPASPRVIWVGIGQGHEELSHLAAPLEDALAALHLPAEEHAFVAHVTLGRVRSPKNRAPLAQRLKELMWTPPAPFSATHLTLFQSALSNSGPTYTVLATMPFQP